MGYWQAALVKVGMAQPGPKITAHDRAILEYVGGSVSTVMVGVVR
jgi:hypothetical protein